MADDRDAQVRARPLERIDREYVDGSTVSRVSRRPHEVRVFLQHEVRDSVRLRFWPARDAEVDVRLADAVVTRITAEDTADGRCEVRIWAGDDVALVAASRSWTFTLYEAAREGGFWLLTEPEKDAVRRAVEAVVHRDAAAVTTLMDPDHWGDTPVEDFWMWVDSHWPADTPTGEPRTPARLLMPPGPVEDWDGDVSRDDGAGDGSASVIVDFLDADAPERPTDLSLELDLSYDADGALRVHAAAAPHVM